MTGFALALVLASAFIHATWNFLAKRAGGGAAFVWLFAALSAIIYAPGAVAIIIFQRSHIGVIELLFIFGSAWGVQHYLLDLHCVSGQRFAWNGVPIAKKHSVCL